VNKNRFIKDNLCPHFKKKSVCSALSAKIDVLNCIINSQGRKKMLGFAVLQPT